MIRRSLPKIFVAGLALLSLGAGSYYIATIRPALHGLEQVANLVELRGYDLAVTDYQHKHGVFPTTLRQAVAEAYGRENRRFRGQDRYGNPVLYRSDGQTYLMVSFGRDGKPDGTDYAALRSAGVHQGCKDVDADQVFSDKGELRSCGK